LQVLTWPNRFNIDADRPIQRKGEHQHAWRVRKIESQARVLAICKLRLSVSIARKMDRFRRAIEGLTQQPSQDAAAKDEAIAIRFKMKRRCAGKFFFIQNRPKLF